MDYVEVYCAETQRKALKLARGNYQVALLNGRQRLSGSDLKGKAAKYAGKYAASARNLLERCRKAELDVWTTVREHGRRVICFGHPPTPYAPGDRCVQLRK